MKEVHRLISRHRAEMNAAMRELALAEQRVSEPNFLFQDDTESGIYDLSDIDEDEESFIDTLRKGNGLLAMSSGYAYEKQDWREKRQKGYAVMEGSLKVWK